MNELKLFIDIIFEDHYALNFTRLYALLNVRLVKLMIYNL